MYPIQNYQFYKAFLRDTGGEEPPHDLLVSPSRQAQCCFHERHYGNLPRSERTGKSKAGPCQLQIELWGPYKWPKINGHCNWFLFHTYKCSYNLTFNWYGDHLERLQISMPNAVKLVQQFHVLFTDICRIVGDGRSLQGSFKPKIREIWKMCLMRRCMQPFHRQSSQNECLSCFPLVN